MGDGMISHLDAHMVPPHPVRDGAILATTKWGESAPDVSVAAQAVAAIQLALEVAIFRCDDTVPQPPYGHLRIMWAR